MLSFIIHLKFNIYEYHPIIHNHIYQNHLYFYHISTLYNYFITVNH
jgi:hypothetical protein